MKNIYNSFIILLILVLSAQNSKAFDLNGNVLYQGDTNRPVNHVTVVLKNIGNNTYRTFVTSGNGFYQFPNVADGNYILSGTTSIPGGGVTYYDAVMVFMHLIGFYEFTPLEFLASDVNGSNTISWTDYNLIIKHLLFGTPFPVGPWRFETVAFTISNLKDGVPHGIGGTCSGDIGGTFVPTLYASPAIPVAQRGAVNVSGTESFTTSLITQNEISITGTGLIIDYPSELLQIESIEFKGSGYECNIENGQIRLVWGNPNTTPITFNEGEAFITINAKCTSEFKKGMTAGLSLNGNTSLMNSSNQEVTNLNFATPVIKFGNPSLTFTNYPNPFSNSSILSINTPDEGNATIEIYNAAGQMVKNIQVGKLISGYHEVTLDASQMAQGSYICKLRIHSENNDLENSIRILKIK